MMKGEIYAKGLISKYGVRGGIFLFLCSFLVGVALYYICGGISFSFIGPLVVIGVLCVMVWFRWYGAILLFIFISIGAGQWYGAWYESFHAVAPHMIDGEYEGVVSWPPRLYDSYQFFTMEDESGMSIGVFSSLNWGVSYGDRVVIKDSLEVIEKDRGYLKARGVDMTSFFPSTISIKKGENSFTKSLFSFRDRIVSHIRIYLPFNEASFAAGTIIGRDSVSFSDDLVDQLIGSGIIHVVALSGYNVSVLVFVIALLFRFVFSRRISVYGSIICIFIFVVMVGAEASVVRAAIMGSVALLGGLYSRSQGQWYGMLFAAWIMVLFRPSLLVYDVGFILSFSALWGILFFAPRLVNILSFSSPVLRGGWRIFVETFSAQIGALPWLLFFFSYISFGGLIANVIILPLIPLVMALASLVGIGVFISQGIGYVVAFPLQALVSFDLFISSLFSHIGSVNTSFSLLGVCIYYGVIVYLSMRYLNTRNYQRIIL